MSGVGQLLARRELLARLGLLAHSKPDNKDPHHWTRSLCLSGFFGLIVCWLVLVACSQELEQRGGGQS